MLSMCATLVKEIRPLLEYLTLVFRILYVNTSIQCNYTTPGECVVLENFVRARDNGEMRG